MTSRILTPVRSRLFLVSVLLVVGTLVSRLEPGAPHRVDEPVIAVRVRYDGGFAETVERRVTRPLEDAFGAVPRLVSLNSISARSESEIILQFDDAASLEAAYLEVRAAVARVVPQLPDAAQPPRILRADRRSPVVMIVALPADDTADPQRIRHLLSRIEGVAEILVAGERPYEATVRLNPERTAAAGISMQRLLRSLRRHVVTGGFARPRHPVAIVDTRFRELSEIARMPVRPSIRLRDVASISERRRPARYISRLNGERRLLLYVTAQGNVNAPALARRLRRSLEPISGAKIVFDRSDGIVRKIASTALRITSGWASAALVLGLRFRSAKAALLCLGGGTAAALGGFSLLAPLGLALDPYGLIAAAAASLLTTALVAAKLQGTAWEPLGAVFMIAAVAAPSVLLPVSFRVALRPLLLVGVAGTCSGYLFLSHCVPARSPAEPAERTRRREPLSSVMRFLLAMTALLGLTLNGPFRSSGNQEDRQLSLLLEYPAGTALASVERSARRVEKVLLTYDEVETVASRYERERARFDLTLMRRYRRAGVISRLRRLRDMVPEAYFGIPERLVTAPHAVVTVTGGGHSELPESAYAFAETISTRPWVEEVVFAFKRPPRSYSFELDADRLSFLGTTPAAIAHGLAWTAADRVAAKWYDGANERDLRVTAGLEGGLGPQDLLEMPLVDSDAGAWRNDELGTLSETIELEQLYRFERRPGVRLSVFFNPERVAQGLAQIKLHAAEAGKLTGHRYTVSSSGASRRTSVPPLVLPVFAVLPCLVLFAAAASARSGLAKITLLLVASAGGATAVWAAGVAFSPAAAAGIVAATTLVLTARPKPAGYTLSIVSLLPCLVFAHPAVPITAFATSALGSLAAARTFAALGRRIGDGGHEP